MLAWIALLAGFHPYTQPEADAVSFTGRAFRMGTETLVYEERHELRAPGGDPRMMTTTYVDADGDTIASREVRYAESLMAPGFELRVREPGLVEGLRYTEQGAQVYRRDGTGGAERSARVANRKGRPLVADAGFNPFIANNWDALVNGETVKFDFVVPSRLDTVAVELAVEHRRPQLGHPAVTFRMVADNPFLRLFMDPIDISYHAEGRYLLRYRGVSNLPQPDGGNYRVDIRFPL